MNAWDHPDWKAAAGEHVRDYANEALRRAQDRVADAKKKPNGGDFTDIAFSDIALAKDFADQNLKLLRFVPLMGKWFAAGSWMSDCSPGSRLRRRVDHRRKSATRGRLRS
jgi:hypothetical protein